MTNTGTVTISLEQYENLVREANAYQFIALTSDYIKFRYLDGSTDMLYNNNQTIESFQDRLENVIDRVIGEQ